MEILKIKEEKILEETVIVKIATPTGIRPIHSTLCFFSAGQPGIKGGEWRTSTGITPKIHNNMSVDPMNQACHVSGHNPNNKGTWETHLKIIVEYSNSLGCFCQKFLTKKIKKGKSNDFKRNINL